MQAFLKFNLGLMRMPVPVRISQSVGGRTKDSPAVMFAREIVDPDERSRRQKTVANAHPHDIRS